MSEPVSNSTLTTVGTSAATSDPTLTTVSTSASTSDPTLTTVGTSAATSDPTLTTVCTSATSTELDAVNSGDDDDTDDSDEDSSDDDTDDSDEDSGDGYVTRTYQKFCYDLRNPHAQPLPPPPDFDAVKIIHSSAKPLFFDDDPVAQLDAVTKFATVLSMGSHDFIDEVLKVPNIVEQLWKFSAQNDYPELKEMALWALNNIAAGWCQHTRVVVASGGIPKLLKLCISKESLIVKMQAIWALGNIAVYSQKTKHQILELGATTLYPLVCMLKDTTTDKSLSSVIMFALLNFFRERIPSKLYFQLQPPISVLVSPTLVDILSMENTREELVLIALHMFACFLASGLYKKDVDKANMYAQIPKFLVHHPKWKEVPNYALLIIRDVDESNKQVLIDNQVLLGLKHLIEVEGLNKRGGDKFIRKGVCRAIANFTAGTSGQLQAVIDMKLISPLLDLTKSESDIKEVAACVIYNVTRGSSEQMMSLPGKESIEVLCELLSSTDQKILESCLKGLDNLLANSAMAEIFFEMVDESVLDYGGVIDKLIALKKHDNTEIGDMAKKIEDKWIAH
ncbi:importin subunit alpha-1b-like [Trifolium pratense]|nr:importin subunit alpha-1b-like [Trifolium pratense]